MSLPKHVNRVSEEKNLKEFTDRFGAVKEGNLEIYNEIKDKVFSQSIVWKKNNDADAIDFPFKVTISDKIWKLRVNNFPDEPMYTLFIEDRAILTFDDRPDTWVIE